jgi:hypothetical protein
MSRLSLGLTQCLIQWVPGLPTKSKVAVAWSRPLTSTYSRGQKCMEVYLCSPCKPWWHGQGLYLLFTCMHYCISPWVYISYSIWTRRHISQFFQSILWQWTRNVNWQPLYIGQVSTVQPQCLWLIKTDKTITKIRIHLQSTMSIWFKELTQYQ